jgi:hypothetical protein
MATRTKTWADFKRWCEGRKLKALPAHPWTIAAYLRWVERRKDALDVRDILGVIAREHLLKSARVPSRHPTVQRTLDLIERRAETRGLRSNLFEDDVFEADPDAPPVKAKRKPSKPPETPKRRVLATQPRLKARRPVP